MWGNIVALLFKIIKSTGHMWYQWKTTNKNSLKRIWLQETNYLMPLFLAAQVTYILVKYMYNYSGGIEYYWNLYLSSSLLYYQMFYSPLTTAVHPKFSYILPWVFLMTPFSPCSTRVLCVPTFWRYWCVLDQNIIVFRYPALYVSNF